MELPLTPGAQRVLASAEALARRAGDPAAGPVHLIWALLADESRAAELLHARGLSRHVVAQRLPLNESPAAPGEPAAPPQPPGDALRLILLEAASLSTRGAPVSEFGTEHLLYALAAIDSPVRALLHEHGIRPYPAALRGGDAAAAEAEQPLPTDVRLELPAAARTEETDACRILDAAANRAREGLRVAEDYARFVLDDRHLAGRLKNARHALTAAVQRVHPGSLAAARDALADVGAALHSPGQQHRESTLQVAQAGLKRAQEAARSLEEFGKLVSPDLAQAAAAVRYELYTIEKALLQTHFSRQRLDECLLCLIVTESLCHHGSGPAVLGALQAGVRMVQVREKHLPDRELLAHARRVRDWTARHGALLIMNDRPDLAALCDADGVHVGQDELSVRDARRIVGPRRLVGVSTHALDQARRAVLEGADYLGVGPVFASSTKQFSRLAGLSYVRDAAAEIALPAFAIGGIHAGNLADVLAAGARRVAVSSAICGAADPEGAARELLAALNRNLACG